MMGFCSRQEPPYNCHPSELEMASEKEMPMPWRRSVMVLGTTVLLMTSCARAAHISTGGTSSIGNSGIRGVLTLGPLCPVQSVRSPCPNKPIEGFVTVMDANGTNVLRAARAGPNGAFTLAMDPGTYRVYAREIGDNPRV